MDKGTGTSNSYKKINLRFLSSLINFLLLLIFTIMETPNQTIQPNKLEMIRHQCENALSTMQPSNAQKIIVVYMDKVWRSLSIQAPFDRVDNLPPGWIYFNWIN